MFPKSSVYYLFIFLVSQSIIPVINGQQTVGLFYNSPESYNGYTLFSSNKFTYLIDNCGNKVNEWQSNYNPGAAVYLLEDGNLLRTCRIGGSFQGGGIGGRLELLDWDSEVIWSYHYANDTVHAHHDIAPMPNGNILLIAWEYISGDEAIEAGRDPQGIFDNKMWPDQIIEIAPKGTTEADTIWIWRAWDHLVQDFDPDKANFDIVSDHPQRIDVNYAASNPNPDWMHSNSIDYNPELDQILLSSRHFNEFYILDHSTTIEEAATESGGNSGKGGGILYRYGNPVVYKRGILADQVLFGQHNVSWIPSGYPNEGKIVLFNNGAGRPDGNYSSVEIFTTPINPDGTYIINDGVPFGPDIYDWQYKANGFFSSRISGAFPLPNGHFLVCEGTKGRLFEIDQAGTIHWEYINPSGFNGPISQGSIPSNNDTFKALRYGPDYPGLADKNLEPGAPVELAPLPSDCMIYENNTGTVKLNGSKPLLININQNPFYDVVHLNIFHEGMHSIQLYTTLGHLLATFDLPKGEHAIDLSHLEAGSYVIHAKNLLKGKKQSILVHKS